MVRNLVVAMLMAVALCGACSKDPRKAVIPTDPKRWDAELAPRVQELDDGDKLLLAQYLLRWSATPEGVPADTTIAMAIVEQRAVEEAKAAAQTQGAGR